MAIYQSPVMLDEVAKLWGFSQIEILEEFNVSGNRAVLLIQTDKGKLVVKGLPDSAPVMVPEGTSKALAFLETKKIRLAPKLIRSLDGSTFLHVGSHYIYVMEFIEGRRMEANVGDEFLLGQAAATLHGITDYGYPCTYDYYYEMNNMKQRFAGHEFKEEYDGILSSLPDFKRYRQCFIHTDIGPHNAVLSTGSEVVFIDLDDAGNGSPYVDLGWPFIMQFVDYNKQTGEMHYDFDITKAFLDGYRSIHEISPDEMELVWAGGIFMHMSYMEVYGPDGVIPMWNILKFGMAQKEKVFQLLK